MTWEDVQNTYKDLGFRAATKFEKQQKARKDYWTSRGLFGSSFYQNEYDDTNKAYNDYQTDINSEFLDLNNERVNAQARGELPEQIAQRRQFDVSRARNLAQLEAGVKRQAAAQPSQRINGQLIGGSDSYPVAPVKAYNDMNPWIYEYQPPGTNKKGWHY